MWYMRIDILDEREGDDKKWNPNEQPDESQEVLREEEYDECDKNRDMHIGRYDPRVEVVRLDRMDDREHSDDERDWDSSAISISDDEDRDPRDKCPKNWDKSKHEHYQWECEYKWKYMSPMNYADDEESNRGEDSIHHSNEWLSTQYSTESIADLASDDSIFLIEECEIPSIHLSEKCCERLAFHHKDIREDESDEELGQDDPSIAEISESRLSDWFESLSIDDIADHLTESEVDLETLLYPIDKSLELSCNLWCSIDELSHLTDDLWDDRDEEKWDNQDE